MDYPDSLSFHALQAEHPDYKIYRPIWDTIDDLSNGGNQIERNKTRYVKIRPGEDFLLFQKRLDRFTYTNILGSGLNEQVSKLNLGSLLINNQDEDPEFWSGFLNNIDRASGYWDFTLELFRTLLQFKWAYIRVNKPVIDQEIETELDAQRLDEFPYVELIKPHTVINWSDIDKDNNFEWVKLRYVTSETSPTSDRNKLICTWVFIDPDNIAYYDLEVKVVDGTIVPFYDNPSIDREYLVPRRGQSIFHNYNSIPIKRVELPDYLWLANQAYLPCLEHLNTSNSLYDTRMTIGYVQRTYEPHEIKTPDSDLDNSYVTAKTTSDRNDPIKSGNQYILKVSEFKFNEAVGSSVTVQRQELKEIEAEVKNNLRFIWIYCPKRVYATVRSVQIF
ncbi:MAG: hypothetical protein HC878_00285 [Leptolyngbyaceae cyanobacterium SL_5_14]|nr:hypothetical protein [Leptolyngbyaceae cyanobacterium SL_5_14]